MVEKFGEGITSLVPTLYASSKGGQDSDKGVRMPPPPPPPPPPQMKPCLCIQDTFKLSQTHFVNVFMLSGGPNGEIYSTYP